MGSKSFAIKGNEIWLIDNGETRKIPKCNVKVFDWDSHENYNKDNIKNVVKFKDDEEKNEEKGQKKTI